MDSTPEVSIVGAGAWGTTLSWMLANGGRRVKLWVREPALAEYMCAERRNMKFGPDLDLPPGVEPSADLPWVLEGASVVILVVPSRYMREVARVAAPQMPAEAALISATKGIEQGSGMRMSEVILEELGGDRAERLVALSGPNLSHEIAHEMPAVSVAAGPNEAMAQLAQGLLSSPLFRVYTNRDIIGVELCGALKNIIAIAAGASDGLGYGDNVKAALITRGLAEMGRLGVCLGAHPATFWGIAGLGDLAATCMSWLSRNWVVGWRLARGEKLPQIERATDSVAEGIHTTRAACELAERLGVELPIAQVVHAVLFEECDPKEAVRRLMAREWKAEVEDWQTA